MKPAAAKWLETYIDNHEVYKGAARLAEDQIRSALSGSVVSLHSVVARAKTVESVSKKLEKKSYGRPSTQMTDVLGVRVITSFSRDVEKVVGRLRSRYEIDDKNSVDKREVLAVGEFGYRSVHLVLRLGKSGTDDPARLLAKTWIEVQVRSIVEHTWAEAEHELRYKSGVTLSTEISRRFNALAGALELVDREFNALAAELVNLVKKYKEEFFRGEGFDARIDSARLIALLMVQRPEANASGPDQIALPFRLAADCAEALRVAEVTTCEQFRNLAEAQATLHVLRDFADSYGIEPERVAGSVVVGAVVGRISSGVLSTYPFLQDPRLLRALAIDGRA